MKPKSSSRIWILACAFRPGVGGNPLFLVFLQLLLCIGIHRLYWKNHVLHPSILVERHARTPPHPMAQPISSMADRNLLWRENAADRFSGVLGIHLAGTCPPVAISKVDGGDGASCPSQAQEFIKRFTARYPLLQRLPARCLLRCPLRRP